MPWCFGARRVAAEEPEAEVAVVRAARPDLLAAEHVVVAVAHGFGRERREVAAGAGLAPQLAPHLAALHHRLEVASLLLGGAVGDDRRPDHRDADAEDVRRQLEAVELLAPHQRLERPGVSAAERCGPRDRGPTSGREQALPLLGLRERLGAVVEAGEHGDLLGGVGAEPRVLLEPRPRLGAELGFTGGVVEVHQLSVRSSCWSGEALGDRHPLGRALAGDLQRGGLDAASLGHDEAEVERVTLDALGGAVGSPSPGVARRGRGARRGARPSGTGQTAVAEREATSAHAEVGDVPEPSRWGRARHRARPRCRGRAPTSPSDGRSRTTSRSSGP